MNVYTNYLEIKFSTFDHLNPVRSDGYTKQIGRIIKFENFFIDS